MSDVARRPARSMTVGELEGLLVRTAPCDRMRLGARVPRGIAPSLELDAQPAARPLLGLAPRARPTSERSWRSPCRPACERSCASALPAARARCSSNPSWRPPPTTCAPTAGRSRSTARPLGAVATEDTRGRPLPHDTRCGPLPGGVVFVASHFADELRLAHLRPRAPLRHPRNGDPAMDLLATILTCSLYASDDAVVRAIAEGPSDKNPYFVAEHRRPCGRGSRRRRRRPRRRRLRAAGRSSPRAAGPCSAFSRFRPSWIDAFGRAARERVRPVHQHRHRHGHALGVRRRVRGKARRAAERQRRMLERTNRRACVLRKYEAAIGVGRLRGGDSARALGPAARERLDRGRAHLRAPEPRAPGALTGCSCPCPSPWRLRAPRPAVLRP